ncbi:MAG: hypothetical protein ACRDZ5_07115 [Acidimicrobiales bacterium]
MARAQEEARSAAGPDEPDYAVAFGRLYAAVASLNPLQAAGEVRAPRPVHADRAP